MLFFQQAEAESEIYCLFTKSWARGKVSCQFYTEATQRHLGRTVRPCAPCPHGACGCGAGAPLPSAPTASLAAANPKRRNSGNDHLHFKQQFQVGPAPNRFDFPGSVFIGADHISESRGTSHFSV